MELTRKSMLTVKRLEDAEVNQQHKMQKNVTLSNILSYMII